MRHYQRLHQLLSHQLRWMADLRNAWFGVSVENREYGLPRIDWLRRTPARLRFLSIEPLLDDLGKINSVGIDWVVVGGESGAGARPIKKSGY